MFNELNHSHSNRFSLLSKVLNHSKDLLFPAVCLVCSKPGADLCEVCCESVERMVEPLCPVCGFAFVKNTAPHLCTDCSSSRPFFERHRSLFVFEGNVRLLMHRFKYGADFAVLGWIRKQWEYFPDQPTDVDLIIPIPLTRAKLKQRGFNQSLELAKIYHRDKTCQARHDVLIRVKDTVSQTGLSKSERSENLQDAFEVVDRNAVQSKSVLLIDDVFTTGATINAAAKILKYAGAAHVQAMTIARGRL